MNDYWYDIMWLHSNVLKEHLEIFENEMLENILNGIRYVPEDVMSKVARQILHINTLVGHFPLHSFNFCILLSCYSVQLFVDCVHARIYH